MTYDYYEFGEEGGSLMRSALRTALRCPAWTRPPGNGSRTIICSPTCTEATPKRSLKKKPRPWPRSYVPAKMCLLTDFHRN